MGALYWQLNDIWQGASWSSLEYGGQWKLSHYFALSFFRPTIVSPVIEGEEVKVWVVCDQPQSDLRLELRTHLFTDLTPTYTGVLASLHCHSPGAQLVYQARLEELLEAGDCRVGSYDSYRLEYCLLSFRLLTATNRLEHENYLMSPPRAVSSLQPAHIRLTVTGRSNEVAAGPYREIYNIQLTTDNVALYVLLTSGECDGRFSDNGFLVTQEMMELQFLSKDYLETAELQNCISVRSYSKQ